MRAGGLIEAGSPDVWAPWSSMTPERYRALRETVGSRREVAKLEGCSPVTVRLREGGHKKITSAAASVVLGAAQELALKEDQARARARRRRMKRLDDAVMQPKEFRTACRILGLDTCSDVALALLADDSRASLGLVSRWRTGRQLVPWWIARDLRGKLGLAPDDPWPTGARNHEVVLDM